MNTKRSFIARAGLLAASLFLFIGSIGYAQEPANIVVTLNVDTGQIEKSNASAFCHFGQDADVSNEDFTIVVNVGDVVTWQGVSTSSPNDIVNIKSINHEGGKNVFDKNILAGNNAVPEKVEAKVLYPTPDGKEYKYKISFTVMNNGVKRNGTFHIDPKIQSH